MTRSLEQEVLELLGGTRADGTPITLGYLARRFGVSTALMTSCAQQIVSKGKAEPAMVMKQGTKTLHGLMPQLALEPVPAAVNAEEFYS
jgi:hypothetical protein